MIYKKLIQRRLWSIKRKDPQFRNLQLAQKLGIEPSYLSRFFSDDKVNFSDELLFELLVALDLEPPQVEKILTLRELDKTNHPLRKKYLEDRLKVLKVQSLRSELLHLKRDLVEMMETII